MANSWCAAIAQLQNLPGIGPWTAHYIAMRILADPDVFLPTDLGMSPIMIYFTHYESPIQSLRLVSDGRSLIGLYMMSEKHLLAPQSDWVEDASVAPFPQTTQQLTAYFAGALTEFDLPLQMQGTTFQQSVWEALKTIPYGRTMSYGELAQQLGQPKASRAVGLANGRNPVSIIVPCHRVIGANGKLTGYGGGIERKQWLLNHECLIFMKQQFNP
jgi:methylated-DNA-[protein]-cysteine S-methyltransferase